MCGIIRSEGSEQKILVVKDSTILVYAFHYLAVNVTEFISAFQRSQSYNLAVHTHVRTIEFMILQDLSNTARRLQPGHILRSSLANAL